MNSFPRYFALNILINVVFFHQGAVKHHNMQTETQPVHLIRALFQATETFCSKIKCLNLLLNFLLFFTGYTVAFMKFLLYSFLMLLRNGKQLRFNRQLNVQAVKTKYAKRGLSLEQNGGTINKHFNITVQSQLIKC